MLRMLIPSCHFVTASMPCPFFIPIPKDGRHRITADSPRQMPIVGKSIESGFPRNNGTHP